jgi:hypothetical protein
MTQKICRPLVMRITSVVMAAALTYSSGAGGFNSAFEALGSALQGIKPRPGMFTDAPTAVYKGLHPGKGGRSRGGVWTKSALFDIEMNDWLASLTPPPPVHTTAVAAEPGHAYPWEGSIGSRKCGTTCTMTNSGCGEHQIRVSADQEH